MLPPKMEPVVKVPEQPELKAPSPPEPNPALKMDWRNKLKGGSSGISINANTNAKKEEEQTTAPEEEQVISGPTEVFSEKAFSDAWKAFLETVQQRKSIIGLLTTSKPTLKNLTEIHLELENKTQESYLQSIQMDMLMFLRERLNNYKMSVVVTFNESETERKPYTAEERYRAMVQANPQLEALRKALDMQIE
jgi:DNA polymerase-3 subunit gamma/tau